MINTCIDSSLKIIFDNFDDCNQYIEKNYNANDVLYYYFDTNLVNGLYNNEIKFKLESVDYLNDSVEIIHMDDESSTLNWMVLNEPTPYGVSIAQTTIDGYKNCIVFTTFGKMVFTYEFEESIEYDIPLTDDEYFNISILHDIHFSSSTIKYIDDFIQKNKNIIDKYKILLENSTYEV